MAEVALNFEICQVYAKVRVTSAKLDQKLFVKILINLREWLKFRLTFRKIILWQKSVGSRPNVSL